MPLIKPDALAALLKKGLAPLYVVHGEEGLLCLEAADQIRAAALKAGYVEREVLQIEGNFDWSLLIEASQSVSLFASQKVLELRLPSGKPGVEGAEALVRFAAQLPEDTVTLLTLPKLDRAQQNSKWFTALSKVAVVVEARAVTREQLPQWIGLRLQQQGLGIDKDALDLLSVYVEGNLLAAKQEIDKLALLYPETKLSLKHVQDAVLSVARFDAFKLGDAWMSGDLSRTLRILDQLEAEGDSPTLVVWAVSQDISALLKLRSGVHSGRSMKELCRELRLWGEKERYAGSVVKRLGGRGLIEAIHQCALVDRQIKGAAEGEPWQSLRQLAQHLCARK